jgi:hypothetical protein
VDEKTVRMEVARAGWENTWSVCGGGLMLYVQMDEKQEFVDEVHVTCTSGWMKMGFFVDDDGCCTCMWTKELGCLWGEDG